MDTVKFFQDESGEWRWHRKSENGRIVSDSGEGYTDHQTCVDMAIMLNGSAVKYDDTDAE